MVADVALFSHHSKMLAIFVTEHTSTSQPSSFSNPRSPPNARNSRNQSGELAAFAGHDVSRWVARGLVASKDDGKSDLDDLSLTGLNRIEMMTLAGWEERFKACGYPVVGRVVLQ